MRRVGQARRRDLIEKPIVEALRAVGAQVTRISGEGAPDILVRLKRLPDGLCYGWEIKSQGGTQTAAQRATDWPIIRTVTEALQAIGIR